MAAIQALRPGVLRALLGVFDSEGEPFRPGMFRSTRRRPMLTWMIALPALVAVGLLTPWLVRRRGRPALRLVLATNALLLMAAMVLLLWR